jgi:hypothetical protein
MAAGKTYVWQSPKNGRWYWRHVARNGREDNGAEQGFASKPYAKRKARNAYPNAKIHEGAPE